MDPNQFPKVTMVTPTLIHLHLTPSCLHQKPQAMKESKSPQVGGDFCSETRVDFLYVAACKFRVPRNSTAKWHICNDIVMTLDSFCGTCRWIPLYPILFPSWHVYTPHGLWTLYIFVGFRSTTMTPRSFKRDPQNKAIITIKSTKD